jgi:hypothetical protein
VFLHKIVQNELDEPSQLIFSEASGEDPFGDRIDMFVEKIQKVGIRMFGEAHLGIKCQQVGSEGEEQKRKGKDKQDSPLEFYSAHASYPRRAHHHTPASSMHPYHIHTSGSNSTRYADSHGRAKRSDKTNQTPLQVYARSSRAEGVLPGSEPDGQEVGSRSSPHFDR